MLQMSFPDIRADDTHNFPITQSKSSLKTLPLVGCHLYVTSKIYILVIIA